MYVKQNKNVRIDSWFYIDILWFLIDRINNKQLLRIQQFDYLCRLRLYKKWKTTLRTWLNYLMKYFFHYQTEISVQDFDKIILWQPSQIDSWFYIQPQKQITVRQQLHTSTVINNLIYHNAWQIWFDYIIHSFQIIWGTKVQEKFGIW